MHISTKGRYGLRILLDVAVHETQGPVALREIARRQAISQKYLWQVVNPLKVAGLLRVTRGARGGYVLARNPARISVSDIVDILEGPVTLVKCAKSPAVCDRSETCVARDVWRTIEDRINETMKGITLEHLVEQERRRNQGGDSYEI
jgi:Rrf2 family protein